jgi:riboflavin kinase
MEGTRIDGYSDGKRTYGWVKCFKAKLNSTFDCELIRLERTHHDTSTIELISKNNLRKNAKLSDGSKITISIPINGK